MRIELHCHTTASRDGMITPDGLLKAATVQGLDVICITDHDTTEGAVEFQRWFQKCGSSTKILIGEERTLDNGCHVIGLLLKQAIHSSSLEDFIHEVKDQDGLIYVPHPFRRKDGLMANLIDPQALLNSAHGWEMYNGKGSASDNETSSHFVADHRLRGLGGSDAHYEADLGACVIETSPDGDATELLRSIFAGRQGYEVLAKPQKITDGERRYASNYYRIKRFLAVPRALLPLAKQLYRRYWNLRHGGKPHRLEGIHQFQV